MLLVETVIGAVGGATVALGVAWYLARRFIDIHISRATEAYKAQLEHRSTILKTELSIHAHEQTVGFSRLDAQRSDAIVKIWDILVDWHEALRELTGPTVEVDNNPIETCMRHMYWGGKLREHAESLSRAINRSVLFFDEESFHRVEQCGG